MLKSIKLFLVIFACSQCLSRIGYCQSKSIFFDHLSMENGLSSDIIFSLCKDKMGMLWIGTSDGLNKYDGTGFKKFYYYENDSNSLWSNFLGKIIQDTNDDLWITGTKGLVKIDPLTEKITRIQFPYNNKKITPGLVDVAENPYDKTIWTCGNSGLFKLDRETNTLIQLMDRDSVLKKSPVSYIFFNTDHDLWLGSYQGLIHYDIAFNKCRVYQPGGLSSIASDRTINIVNCIKKDRSGQLWIGTWGHGLQLFDPQTKMFTMFLPQPELGVRNDANIVLDIMPSKLPGEEHVLWLAGEGIGFMMFNTITHKFISYSTSDRKDRYKVYNGVRCLCYADNEGLWLGTLNGLYRYDPHLQTFRVHSIKEQLSGYCLSDILAMCADSKDPTGNTLYICTWSCGNYMYNTGTGALKPTLTWLMDRYPARSTYISAILKDKQDRLWVGLNTRSLLQVDELKRSTKEICYYNPATKEKIPLYTRHILEDTVQHCLWLGCENGLYRLDLSDQKVYLVYNADHAKGYSDRIFGLAFDNNGQLWFGTISKGSDKPLLGRVDRKAMQVTFYRHDGHNGIPDLDVMGNLSYNPVSKNMWCATERGLLYWNAGGSPPSFHFLTRKDGISSDHLYGVSVDRDHGYVWMVTQNSLSCYDERKKIFKNFNATHGLTFNDPGNIFTNSVTGNVVVTTTGTFYQVNSEALTLTYAPPPVYILSVKVFDKPYLKDSSQFFPDKQEIALRANQNNVTIGFAGLNFTTPQENRYAYKLEGVDEDWNYTGNNTVTYSHLPPGNHTFKVKACNSLGIWNENGTWLHIYIATPFYKTSWFILGCIFLLTMTFYLVYRYRIAQFKKLLKIRSDIARDLHDEVGSTLTSINILSKVSTANFEKDRVVAKKYMEQISEQSQLIQQNMSDIVWAIKPDEDKVENMVIRMRDYITHTLEPRNIIVDFSVSDNLLKDDLSMQQRRDLFMVFKEAVNNIAKYADANAVYIWLDKRNNNLSLAIKDNGKGFDLVHVKRSNGLKNMRERTVGMKGVFTLESIPGNGTTIRIEIPMNG